LRLGQAPLWSSLFEASSRTIDKHVTAAFIDTPHFHISALAFNLVRSRASSEEAKALSELWVSTGVFDALETAFEEALRYGTENEQIHFCRHAMNIYHAIFFGRERNVLFATLISQQLPRPRTIRRLWDLSLRLSSKGTNNVVWSHAARVIVLSLEQTYFLPSQCTRRGCEKKATARCPHCKAGYCGRDCQKPDWKDHKLVCGVKMDMEPAIRDEAFRLIAGDAALAQRRAEMGLR